MGGFGSVLEGLGVFFGGFGGVGSFFLGGGLMVWQFLNLKLKFLIFFGVFGSSSLWSLIYTTRQRPLKTTFVDGAKRRQQKLIFRGESPETNLTSSG